MSFRNLPNNLGRCLNDKEDAQIYLSSDENYVFKFTTYDNSKEYEMMNYVQSPYTVPALNYIETADWNCLILPAYLDGDAFTLIENNEVNEENTKQIIYDILKGLIHLESINVIHHDIKPENVFITRDDKTIHAVIGDFGLAEIVGHNMPIGCTYRYAAPEILSNDSYDFNCDMWSIGVFMAVFLSNEMPFDGDQYEILEQIHSTKVELPPYVSPEAQDLLDRLLCVDPVFRITPSEAIQHPWFANIEA